MKARTKGQKRRGRPPKQGVLRTESGRISRSAEARQIEAATKAFEYRLMMEAATWKRRQIDPSLSFEDARKQERGSVIHYLKNQHDIFVKKYGEDKPNPMRFTGHERQVAENVHEAYERYRAAIASHNPRSASDFSGPGGFDGSDPFDEYRETRDAKAIERWKEMRRAILESGPLGMMAVETIIFENTLSERLIGDLRLAINAVDRLSRYSKAA